MFDLIFLLAILAFSVNSAYFRISTDMFNVQVDVAVFDWDYVVYQKFKPWMWIVEVDWEFVVDFLGFRFEI